MSYTLSFKKFNFLSNNFQYDSSIIYKFLLLSYLLLGYFVLAPQSRGTKRWSWVSIWDELRLDDSQGPRARSPSLLNPTRPTCRLRGIGVSVLRNQRRSWLRIYIPQITTGSTRFQRIGVPREVVMNWCIPHSLNHT